MNKKFRKTVDVAAQILARTITNKSYITSALIGGTLRYIYTKNPADIVKVGGVVMGVIAGVNVIAGTIQCRHNICNDDVEQIEVTFES